MSTTPDFRSPEFLREHMAQTMTFHHPHAIDPAGGFFHCFKDDGICDGDKCFWVQAESLVAAALLHRHTGERTCDDWYARLWNYA